MTLLATILWVALPSIACAQLACNLDPIDGPQVTVEQWHSSSGWKQLTNDASSVSSLRINVLGNGSTGNVVNLLNNWSQQVIGSVTCDIGTCYIDIPSGTGGSLQYWIDHIGGSVYSAEVKLCTGTSSTNAPTPSPTPAPTPLPTKAPTKSPTPAPTPAPVSSPIASPVSSPTSSSCDVLPLSGSSLNVPQWNGSSGWKHLADDATQVCEVDVTVLDNSMTGNVFHMLSDWDPNPIVSQQMDTSNKVIVPAGTTGSLQFYLEHATGAEYVAQVMLCPSCGGGPPVASPVPPPVASPVQSPVSQPTGPTPSCSNSDYSAFSVPQLCLPPAMGTSESDSFSLWRTQIDGGTLGTSIIGEDCRDLHDRFWVKGDDDKAYHTWHPPVVDGCVFRHEHGDDAKVSNIFNYAQGYPPFAYVAEQWTGRDEDHFGHKIVVANDVKMAIGEPQNGDVVHDAGITCQWFSKLHQGTYSADAFTNDLHEYFLNVECDDTQFGDNTAFSVKALLQWGSPNQFMLYESQLYNDVVLEGESELTYPWNGQPDLIPTNFAVAPNALYNNGGLREIDSFPGLQWKTWTSPSTVRQPELWSGPSAGKLDIPNGGSISIAPYYIVKNPSRLARPLPNDPTRFVVKRTVDWCYDENNNRIPGGFCSLLPQTHPGPDYYKSEQSPFKGTVRALNFKNLELRNDDGPSEFCTDVFGQNPTNVPCGAGEIHQRANTISNYWKSQSNPSNPCVQDVTGVCHNMNLAGSIERWTFGYDQTSGQWEASRVGAQPLGGADYQGAGIGYEWIINHGNAEGVRVPN